MRTSSRTTFCSARRLVRSGCCSGAAAETAAAGRCCVGAQGAAAGARRAAAASPGAGTSSVAIRLVDFGNAFSLTETDHTTVACEVQTLPYRAPEVCVGGQVTNKREKRNKGGGGGARKPVRRSWAWRDGTQHVGSCCHVRRATQRLAFFCECFKHPATSAGLHLLSVPPLPQAALGLPHGAGLDLWSVGVVLAEIALKRALLPCAAPRDLLCQVSEGFHKQEAAEELWRWTAFEQHRQAAQLRAAVAPSCVALVLVIR